MRRCPGEGDLVGTPWRAAEPDGLGPVGDGGVVTSDGSSSTTFSFEEGSPGPCTFGLQLCLAQGAQPAFIERVYADQTVGSGLRFLGALAHESSVDGGAIGTAGGFPPSQSGKLPPAAGFPVIYPCSAMAHGDYTEVLVGIAKPAGSTGGGWAGIDVAYRLGSRQYVVTLAESYYTCGSAAPAAAECNAADLMPTPSVSSP